MDISNKIISSAAILICLSICFGAFGAHALKAKMDVYSTSIFEKAVFYHVTQSIALMLIGILPKLGILKETQANSIFLLILFGIIVFSGSLYALAVSGLKWLGAITPIGGTSLIVAWALLAYRIIKA